MHNSMSKDFCYGARILPLIVATYSMLCSAKYATIVDSLIKQFQKNNVLNKIYDKG